MKLYGYWRSSAAYRVRIALNLKGVAAEHVPVNLLAGEQRGDAYRAKNPAGLVPALELDDGTLLTQSMAMIEWLDETFPEPPLLPADAVARARVRAAALTLAADTHPLGNLRVQQRLGQSFNADGDARIGWATHWMTTGLAHLEAQVAGGQGRCLFGEEPGLADIMLVPQMYNARRFGVDLGALPRLVDADGYCRTLPAFAAAAPEAQPDAGA